MTQEMFFFFDQVKIGVLQDQEQAILRFRGSLADENINPLQFRRFIDYLTKLNDSFLLDFRGLVQYDDTLLEILSLLMENRKNIRLLTQGGPLDEQIRQLGLNPNG